MDGVEFFANLPNDKTRGAALRNREAPNPAAWHQQLIAWEHVSVETSSPGPVLDKEILRLYLFDPHHVQDGLISRMAFKAIEELGMSVDRDSHTTLNECRSRANRKAERDGKVAWGYLDMSAKFLRDIRSDDCKGQQVLGVYDTSVPPSENDSGNRSHAEVFKLVHLSHTKPSKSIQQNLYQEYEDRIRAWDAGSNATSEPDRA